MNIKSLGSRALSWLRSVLYGRKKYDNWIKDNIKSQNIEHSKVDIYIVSYPKSGRTWLRYLIGKALCLQNNLNEAYIPETYHLSEKIGGPIIQFTHSGMDFTKAHKYKCGHMPNLKDWFNEKEIVLLIRDPRDILVSAYYWLSEKKNCYSGTISEFIRTDEYGIRRIIHFYNHWYKNRNIPAGFRVLSYEHMSISPLEELKKFLDRFKFFCEMDHLRGAVQFGRFENMQRLEKKMKYRFLQPGNVTNAQSFKVRSGEVGGFRRELSLQDIEYIDTVIKEMKCPLFNDSQLTKIYDYNNARYK